MRYLKSALLSLVCVICLFLVTIVAAGAVCVHRTINLPEPESIERVIIFAEINSSIFEVEKREPVTVKGKKKAIEIFNVVGKR